MKCIIESGELYTEPSFSLDDISKETGYSRNIISQVINRKTDNNFNYFIKQYRIEKAKNFFVMLIIIFTLFLRLPMNPGLIQSHYLTHHLKKKPVKLHRILEEIKKEVNEVFSYLINF